MRRVWKLRFSRRSWLTKRQTGWMANTLFGQTKWRCIYEGVCETKGGLEEEQTDSERNMVVWFYKLGGRSWYLIFIPHVALKPIFSFCGRLFVSLSRHVYCVYVRVCLCVCWWMRCLGDGLSGMRVTYKTPFNYYHCSYSVFFLVKKDHKGGKGGWGEERKWDLKGWFII